jgi:hypothetical protein
MIIPLVVFDLAAPHVGDSSPLTFVGGLTYPLYAGWWISRVRHPRLRAILLHLLAFATAMAALVLLLDALGKQGVVIALFMPATLLLPSLALLLVRAAQRRGYDARTHLYGLLLLLPFALLLTWLLLYAVGMSAMQGMRW